MSLRISSAFISLALLAACGGVESPPPPGDEVDCAIGAGSDFSPVCTLELVAGAREMGTREMVLHHREGGFRRLRFYPDSGTLATFDGAEPVMPEPGEGAAVQFAIGEDRYRIPQALLEPPAP